MLAQRRCYAWPCAPYLFTPQVAHTSHACVQEQRGSLLLFLRPCRFLRLRVVSRNFYLIINLCCCTRQLCLCLRHIENLRLSPFMQFLCIHLVDIKIPQSCTPLNRRCIVWPAALLVCRQHKAVLTWRLNRFTQCSGDMAAWPVTLNVMLWRFNALPFLRS